MGIPLSGQNKDGNALESIPRIAVSKELDLTATAAVYPVIHIPAGTYVTGVQILVTAAITVGSMDIDIGDGDAADRFDAAWVAATGALALGSIIDCPCGGVDGRGVTSGRYYASADTIDVDINTVASAGKIKLLVHCTSLGSEAPAALTEKPVDGVL